MILKKNLFFFMHLFSRGSFFCLFSLLSTTLVFSKEDPAPALSQPLKKHVFFIINPISGGIDKEDVVKKIESKLSKEKFSIEIHYTKGPKHATELAKEALKRSATIIAVVGGDGTVNEVSQVLIGSPAILAIIPTGSGNGLARHLHIPLKSSKAIDLIKKGKVETIDTVLINDRHYLGVAGIGFDAEVGWKFSEFGHRGFLSYLLLTLKELPTYHPGAYDLIIDGKKISREAFLVSFANSSQFGNGACIAPQAKINDGNLDVIIVKKFPPYGTVKIASQLFHHTLNQSKYVETIKCKEIIISQPNLKAHIDGEPVIFPRGIHLKIVPSSLQILVPY
jgi:YegS/Rv2252/BmrU family lipid kinase